MKRYNCILSNCCLCCTLSMLFCTYCTLTDPFHTKAWPIFFFLFCKIQIKIRFQTRNFLMAGNIFIKLMLTHFKSHIIFWLYRSYVFGSLARTLTKFIISNSLQCGSVGSGKTTMWLVTVQHCLVRKPFKYLLSANPRICLFSKKYCFSYRLLHHVASWN